MNSPKNDEWIAYFLGENKPSSLVQMILSKAQSRMPPLEDGKRYPIISLEGCTEAEMEIVGQSIKEQSDQAQWRLAEQTTPQPEPPPSYFGMAYPGPTYPGSCVQEISRLLHGEKKKVQEPSVYDAMLIVLEHMRLVYFDGSFYCQNGAIFQRVSDAQLKTAIFGVLEPMIAAGKNPKIVDMVFSALKLNGNIQATQTSDDGDRLFFLNGAYSISRRQLELLSPTDFFTCYVPIQYTPQYGGCPHFEMYLERVSGGDERIKRLIWEMIGYLLVPDMEGKVFFVLLGVGDTGKSLLGNLISSLFNPEAISHMDIYRFRDRFATSSLRGKRLNVCMDLPKAQISREAIGVIKMVTGDDTITTEEKFKAAESYKPTCKLLFGSNFPLMPADNDEAFRSRLVTVPFRYPVPPEQQDKHLLEKLMGERPAIVMKALDTLQDLRARNYQFTTIDQPLGVNGYIVEHQLMDEFLTRCCCLDATAFTFTADLLEVYNTYRASRNVPPLNNASAFSRDLNRFCAGRLQSGRLRRDGKNQNGYYGIRIIKFKEDN